MIKNHLLCSALMLFPLFVFAQNTGGVFSPVVNEGHRSIQYRGVVDPDNSQGELGFAQRFHYQEAVNGDLLWRLIGQTRKTTDSDFDFDFVQAELFWDLGEDGDRRRTGFRFDLRLRDKDRPNQFGVNWMNQFLFESGWTGRAILLTSHQFGENAANGIALGSRFQIARTLQNNHSIGVEMFNSYGRINHLGGFQSQSHTVGPIYTLPFFDSEWSLFSGVLFGLSDASADAEFRFRFGRNL